MEITKVKQIKYASRRSANLRIRRLKRKEFEKENSEMDT